MVNSSIVKILACTMGILLGSACSTLKPSDQRGALTLDKVEKLQVGKTIREEAAQLLGNPEMKPDVPELQGKEAWLYLTEDHKSTRLSLVFESATGRLYSANWFVSPEDPESNLDFVKERYRPVLERREAKWTTPDAGPEQVFFIDKRSGLKIACGKSDNRVEALVWGRPTSENVAGK